MEICAQLGLLLYLPIEGPSLSGGLKLVFLEGSEQIELGMRTVRSSLPKSMWETSQTGELTLVAMNAIEFPQNASGILGERRLGPFDRAVKI